MRLLDDSQVPKEGKYCVCLCVTATDSTMKINGKFYPQVYLEERKYVVRRSMMSNFVDAELHVDSSNDFHGSDSK